MENTALLDHYPWAANHANAIRIIAAFMRVDFEVVLKILDERILGKVAKENLCAPKAA
ncbi:MAG TPA: hypothetical protein VIM41_10195 [Gammaproteobacteria bacterium]